MKLREFIKEEIRNLLLEDRVDFLRDKYLSLIIDYGHMNNKYFFDLILWGDPTSHKEYLQWLLIQFIKIQHSKGDVYDFRQDIVKYKEYLTLFHKYKHTLPLEQRDINKHNLKSLKELALILKDKEPKIQYVTPKEVSNYIIGEVSGFTIYKLPKGDLSTKKLAISLGRGTEWCTAYDDLEGETPFDEYIEEGPLYILINNSDPSEKYQFHFESGQFMDKDDSDIFGNRPDLSDEFPDLDDGDDGDAWGNEDFLRRFKEEQSKHNVIKFLPLFQFLEKYEGIQLDGWKSHFKN